MGALGGALPRDSVPPAFDGPASLCPAAEAGVGREATVRAPPATCHSAVSPGFRDCPAFLRGHFPPESAPSYPSIRLSTVNSSPHPGWLHSPSTPARCRCAFQGVYVALWGVYGCGKDCLSLIPFKMPQISWFTPSLKGFSSDPDNCPSVGIGPLLQSPHPPKAGPVLPTPVFPPSSFVLPSFARVYIFLSTGQVLLSALSWPSACTSVSEAVFLMYPWREMYSMSTYSFTILFSLNSALYE